MAEYNRLSMLWHDVHEGSQHITRYMNAGGREWGKEGRKQGGELEWAAFPVLNFKHRPLFSCCLLCPGWDNPGINQSPLLGELQVCSSHPEPASSSCEHGVTCWATGAFTEETGTVWAHSSCWGALVLLRPLVSCSSQFLRYWFPLTPQRPNVKERAVRIQTTLRSNCLWKILFQCCCSCTWLLQSVWLRVPFLFINFTSVNLFFLLLALLCKASCSVTWLQILFQLWRYRLM